MPWALQNHELKGQGYGNDSAYYSDPVASRRHSGLTLQQRLGLLSGRRHWSDSVDRSHPDPHGADLNYFFNNEASHELGSSQGKLETDERKAQAKMGQTDR